MAKLIFKESAWDPGESIITVRPDWEKLWKDVPIGHTLSRRDARMIAQWITSAYRELEIIFKNGYEEPGSASNQRTRTYVWEGLGDALDFIHWSIEEIAKGKDTSFDALPGKWKLTVEYIEES